MIFHVFNSQDERRSFGGSAFLEIQFCKLAVGTPKKKLNSVNDIDNWKNDSLYIYVDYLDTFFQEYNSILNCDVCGFTYYEPSSINTIIEKIHSSKPIEYERFTSWLNEAKKYNGFYILGI